MKKLINIKSCTIAVLIVTLTACTKDLDLSPKYGLNSVSVYEDPNNYIHVLAKIYAGFNLSGNKGPAGQPDLGGIDEGFSSYVRVLWNLQELPTDEAVCAWSDPGIPDLNKMTWSADNSFVKAMYYRIYFQVALCNEFIRETEDGKLESRGFTDAQVSSIKQYRLEARFLRALSYYHQLDLFGTGPFVDEDDQPGSYFPPQINSLDLFNYIEKELLEIEPLITPAKQNEYARADRAAVDALLAKLYLNAKVYTANPRGAGNGTARWNDCITYCNKVIAAGYQLDSDYKWLYLSDNNQSTEVIFPITADGLYTQSYGCTTFLVHAAIGGSMPAASFGVNGGWGGIRSTKNLVFAFGSDTLTDGRALFYTTGQNLEINDITKFTDGYAVTKYKNVDRNGVKGSDATGNYVDTDFPMLRLADIYLMYAEATLQGGNGDLNTAIGYVNQLRERAYGNQSANVTSIDMNFIMNERAREMYWECWRRSDLVRWGVFTGGTYVWPYKGGDPAGISVPTYLDLYPLPSADLAANTNLKQNPGY